jgi:hypothetical protein
MGPLGTEFIYKRILLKKFSQNRSRNAAGTDIHFKNIHKIPPKPFPQRCGSPPALAAAAVKTLLIFPPAPCLLAAA